MDMQNEVPEGGRAKGGRARAESLTPEQRTEIARLGAQSRWDSSKLPRATHSGVVKIGDIEIPCAVLDTGQRVLTQSGFMRALGRARQAKGRQYYDADVNMPAFLTAKNIRPFVSKDLEVTSSQILFRQKGHKAFGYPAELLPQVCGVFLDALKAGVLVPTQLHIAEKAQILIRGLATVGIVALVDEATGFQEYRDSQALQAILDAYLKKEFAAWAKRFPDEFYYHIFRLKNWEWKGRKVNPPQVVAHFTKDIVYSRLAPHILEELERRNPMENGRRRSRHHQWLTEDIGHPALAQHLHAVITLMRVSSTWEQFMAMLDVAHPPRGDTMLFSFMAENLCPASALPVDVPTATVELFSQSHDGAPAAETEPLPSQP